MLELLLLLFLLLLNNILEKPVSITMLIQLKDLSSYVFDLYRLRNYISDKTLVDKEKESLVRTYIPRNQPNIFKKTKHSVGISMPKKP